MAEITHFKFPWAKADLAPTKRGLLAEFKQLRIDVPDVGDNQSSTLLHVLDYVPIRWLQSKV